MYIDEIRRETYWNTVEISKGFLDYYQSCAYDVIPGSSLLDPSVPMSFVMSAGLVQVERSAARFGGRHKKRYVLLQNCFRYFDLATVGTSDYHLTLFQMAGAFSFGEIKRKVCFTKVWKLLTQVYGLKPDNLWVTYFHGGEVAGYQFEADDETHRAWLSIGVPENRIVGLGPDENFWKQSSGVIGEAEAPKCGPNTEVFFDRGEILKCSPCCQPGCYCGRFVEIQNLLLISWHLDDEIGILRPLEEPFVEVVMGVERMAMLLQGRENVFDTDILLPLVNFVQANSPNTVDMKKIANARILVDHLRALIFLIADGAPAPGRGGRARLMRQLARGAFTAERLLNISDKDFLAKLLSHMMLAFQDQKSNLTNFQDQLLSTMEEERKVFEKTLKIGERKLDRIIHKAPKKISGEDMIFLEKEQGFPHDLLLSILDKRQISFSKEAYQRSYHTWYKRVSSQAPISKMR
jgi:alanyl-tRNA synthetase